MQQMTLFSHDDPLVTFELQAGAPILLRHIYHENAHLLPFSLRGKELQEVLPDWLSNRFSENGLWLIHALKKHNTSIDMLSALQITSALSLTDAFWIHDGSKTWSNENLFTNEFSEDIANLAISRGLAPRAIKRIDRSPEYTSEGSLRKCWVRRNKELFLLKAANRSRQSKNNQAIAES
ncbi:MAG: hypothetical protein IJU37_01405 [Desulfovibrio sp.]|nr:hypothetical protein [Desulfovibrio sp.]